MSARTPLLVFPSFQSNPYVTITLLAAASAGFDIEHEKGIDTLIDRLDTLDGGSLFHLHWTGPICQQAPDVTEASRLLATFRRSVTQFRRRGGRMVWTVHNAQPHELNYPDIELELLEFLVDQVDVIHVMNPATAEIMELVDLPTERIRHVNHPSYVGLYGRTRSREAMRSELGFDPDQRVVSLIGELRPYKGVGTLFDALTTLTRRGAEPPAALIAGKASPHDAAEVADLLPDGVSCVVRTEYIPSGRLADWFGVADLCVLPYRRILNSGSAHLAATMGVPVAAPDEPSLVHQFGDEPWVHLYDRGRPAEALADVLSDPGSYVAHPERTAEFCRERSPWRTAQLMLDVVYEPLR